MEIHVVSRGETLYRIADFYGTTVSRIVQDNGLSSDDPLVVGQALLILIPAEIHTVSVGETLFGIAVQNDTSVMHLIQNNPSLAQNTTLRPGERIVVRYDVESAGPISVSGYAYPTIGRRELRSALPYLTYLHIFSYGYSNTGDLYPVDDADLIRQAYEFQVAPVMVLSGIGSGNYETSFEVLLQNTVLQNLVIANLIQTMTERGYLGLDVDFEYIAPELAADYLSFLENLRNQLHGAGFFLHVDLAPKTYAAQPGLLYEAHNYQAIGEIADQVLLMTYEWGYTYGPPMSVAPLNQVRRVVEYGVEEILPSKILMGIPNYGYDWRLPYERGISRATSIGNQRAISIAAQNRAEVLFDERAASPTFGYFRDGAEHVVWFEDVRSIEQKLQLRDEFRLKGVGYWNIMRPFAQNWAYLGTSYDVAKIVAPAI